MAPMSMTPVAFYEPSELTQCTTREVHRFRVIAAHTQRANDLGKALLANGEVAEESSRSWPIA